MDTIIGCGLEALLHVAGFGRFGRAHVQERLLTTDATEFYATAIMTTRLGSWIMPSLKLGFDTLFPHAAATYEVTRIASPPPRPLRVFILSVLNMALVTALEVGLAFGFKYVTGTSVLPAPPTLPSRWRIITHVINLMLLRNVLADFVYRYLLHDTRTFPMLTRLHLRWAHIDSYAAGHPYVEHPLLFILRHTEHPRSSRPSPFGLISRLT